jgi:serine/threonine-protein kinase
MPNGTPSQAPGASEAGQKQSGPDPLIGRLINDRFKISALIARGGMGKVYKAEQAPLGRQCALKVLNPNYSGEHDPEFHKRFFLEASISAKLTHPNTVTIFDYGRTDDNIYYMAMELLEGRTLHRALREEGPFTEERATHIARQICRSLREAHSLGVIHRDLKPANVYLIEHGDETDFVKVLDFGLVKNIDEGKGEDLTQTGLFMGSPKYMAPEQIRGEHVDARTDIYALGIMMYEMITGKVPFDRPNSVNILMAHVNEKVPALRDMNPSIQVSEAFEAAIFKCVEKRQEDRFTTMDEVLAALKRAGGGALTGTMSGHGMERSGTFDMLSTTGSFTPSGGNPGISPLSPDPSGSHTGALLAAAQPIETKKSSKAPLIVGLLAAVAIVIGIVVVVTGKGDKDKGAASGQPSAGLSSNPTASAKPANSAATTTSASTTASAAPKKIVVKIDSDPSGAKIKDGDATVCDKTPCDLSIDGKERKITLVLDGYKDETVLVSDTDTDRKIALSKKAATWTAPKTTTTGAATKPPSEFKPDPYGTKPDPY